MRVIKLGGSLLCSEKMLACLQQILNVKKQTVVVCGGGDFANQVRQAQKKWHFDDIVAHEMAILAMQQNAIMLQNLCPEFRIENRISTIKNSLFSIWSPDIKELNAAKIPASWEITSDSLAAWLATKLDAEKLIVVKSCDINSRLTIDDLVEQKIVDGEFPHFINCAKFELTILSADAFLHS